MPFAVADSVDLWVESLTLLGLLAIIGLMLYRRRVYPRVRRRLRRTSRDPYQGDAEDFERLLF